MTVTFSDGRTVTVSLRYFPRLCEAESQRREHWERIGRGLGVHWPDLDEDLSVGNILLAHGRSKAREYAGLAGPE